MIRKLFLALLIIFALAALFYFAYYKKESPQQRAASQIDSLVSAERIKNIVDTLAAKPHPPGSEENRKVGDAIIDALKQLGLEVTTSEYQVAIYEPLENRLTLTAPESVELSIREKPVPEDRYSAIAGAEIPFFAYTPDADIEADVVYANFGTREDYAALKKLGIDPAGKIALVRAQGICRSMKAVIAEEEGVSALLLFPELRDQGMQRPRFPAGSLMNTSTVQRGSMLRYFDLPGDVDNGKTNVPALPVNEETARRLFQNLSGTVMPSEWQGLLTLPDPYKTGPGPARVHLTIHGKTENKTIRNIFATMRGANKSEPAILAASHYDAWVYGACDPISGVASILETARVLSELKKDGWEPARNIIFAFWDGEEYGLLGSSRWVTENLAKVQKEIGVHVYVDSIRSKNFTAYLTPGLDPELEEALKSVNDPEQERPFSEFHGTFNVPGYSDDTAPFTGLAGTPSARLGFGTHYSMYHSLYDDPFWMGEFGDPGYKFTATLVKILTLYVRSLSTDAILPFRFSQISFAIEDKAAAQALSDPSLDAELQKYDQTAKRLEELLRAKRNLPPESAARVNTLMLQAMQSFLSSDAPFPKRNQLIGSSESEGCVGEIAPPVSNGKPEELKRLREAIGRSREVLDEAIQELSRS